MEAVVNCIWITALLACPQTASHFYSDNTKTPPDVLVLYLLAEDLQSCYSATAVDEKSQMAGSRLERFGTVFTRVRDLMRSGVIKPPEKPIWYDVYEAFPPRRDPLHVKPHTRPFTKTQETVPEIFYREDEVRAKFYEQYGTGPRPFDLSKSNFVSTCQRFVDKYTELKSHSKLDDSTLFEETGKALLTDGTVLRRRGAPPVSAESRDPVLKLKLTDMLAEQQSVGADSEETTEHTTHTP